MKIHLVGGFLGSGKTTAIISASRLLMAGGKKVGVITNDQGKYLVDTAFVRLNDIPAVEVNGGCFCCRYDDLDDSLEQLVEQVNPDVVFAESVGSCADLVATVLKPLLTLESSRFRPSSLSVFADARLLRRRLRGQPMPFSEDVIYVFDKQLEEAQLLVVNKEDLVSESDHAEIRDSLAEKMPGKEVLFLNAQNPERVARWLERIQTASYTPGNSLEIDYQRYGQGERLLAWLDAVMDITSQPNLTFNRLIDGVLGGLQARGAGVGHLKCSLSVNGRPRKVSFMAADQPGAGFQLAANETVDAGPITLNIRAELPAEALKDLFTKEIGKLEPHLRVRSVDVFHPGQPVPVHRL